MAKTRPTKHIREYWISVEDDKGMCLCEVKEHSVVVPVGYHARLKSRRL